MGDPTIGVTGQAWVLSPRSPGSFPRRMSEPMSTTLLAPNRTLRSFLQSSRHHLNKPRMRGSSPRRYLRTFAPSILRLFTDQWCVLTSPQCKNLLRRLTSQGSLAYFAKGPLSRARSEFHLDLESNLDMADLIIFLQSLILTTVQIDKKYRETVPKLIEQARNMAEASDEGTRKKRKLKKMRLGKDALYPHEDECIREWWDSNKPAPAEEDQSLSASQVNTPVAILRTRETQLQMILIFEILALEMLSNAENRDTSSLPTLPGAESGDQNPSTAVPHRRRNKHNLPVLIDVHADRLTIWQSIASDVQNLVGESQNTLVSQDSQVQQQPSSEPLKDFCVDVIVPL